MIRTASSKCVTDSLSVLRPAKPAARISIAIALAGVFLWLLAVRLAHVEWNDVRAGFVGVAWHQWLAAGVATGVSFWAVGRYDAVLHRHLSTNVADQQSRRAGICAIAVSQTTGLGVITGAILRWRMLPGQTLAQALRLSIAVALSFLLGWAVVTALVIMALPGAPFKPAALTVLGVAAVLCGFCLLSRSTLFRLPNGITLAQLLGLCAVDTIAAGFAFYLLCPVDMAISFVQLLPVFLLAFGAGLLSGTPGGVGAFELTLFALLPAFAEPELVAVVLAWRAVYYALPAVLGAGLAVQGPKIVCPSPPSVAARIRPALHCSPSGLAQHAQCEGGPGVVQGWQTARTPHFLVGLSDPADVEAIADLAACARSKNRLPLLYQAPARSAALARKSGFVSFRIARNAWLNPVRFDLATPPRAGLRRKLRRAHALGITITAAAPGDPVPWQHLDRMADDWASAHGGERGFSMGRYSRNYVRQQRIYIAWQNAAPVAFVTFHQTCGLWVLDLMRHAADQPDGAMHALIHAAITDAAQHGVPRLSLAAVPDFAIGRRGGYLERMIARRGLRNCGGLAQFKSSFAPDWRPVYLCVPWRAALPLACLEIARAVFWPKPLPDPHLQTTDPVIEHDHEDYEFAYAHTAWHRRAE